MLFVAAFSSPRRLGGKGSKLVERQDVKVMGHGHRQLSLVSTPIAISGLMFARLQRQSWGPAVNSLLLKFAGRGSFP